MYIVHVSIKVKEQHISAFRKVSIENARNSLNETGVARFDVLQQQDDPSNFLLVEVYYTPEAQLKHRETEHFKKWRAAIADMIAEPYTFVKYDNSFPNESGWANVSQ
ncbi:putative quinol monooxygenase [Aneurinibacillus terranovensis]|uniref:putative quinol monooxygenase n=1 Tax=Aneurinibacillus terranovensis TaxID=278991 RepID=UPI0004080B39|nr:putative quinol monooxygenase [Aneurinibacillus terranovensis]